jgi:hypothetical protein
VKAVAPSPIAVKVGDRLRLMARTARLFHSSIVSKTMRIYQYQLAAANAGAARDHRQADRVEQLVAQNEQLEQQNQGLVEQLVGIERLIDQHMAQSVAAHSTEIHAVYALTRDLHRRLTNDADVSGDGLWPDTHPGSASEAGS